MCICSIGCTELLSGQPRASKQLFQCPEAFFFLFDLLRIPDNTQAVVFQKCLHVTGKRPDILRRRIQNLIPLLLQLLCGLAIIVVVLFQSGKSAGLSGAIGGVADSFLSRNKAKTWDAKLARATKWVGAVFLVLTMVLLILQG